MALLYTAFPEKVFIKWNKELVELHKRVITTYLASKGVKYGTRVKFFKLYDMEINEDNIKCYFYTPTPLLVQYLVLGRVSEVSTYIIHPHGRKKRTSRKR